MPITRAAPSLRLSKLSTIEASTTGCSRTARPPGKGAASAEGGGGGGGGGAAADGGVRTAGVGVIEGMVGGEAAGGDGDGTATLTEAPGTPTAAAILSRKEARELSGGD